MPLNSKVTIVGAGNVGATTALLLAQAGVGETCLIDIAEGVPQGKALDLMHMRSLLHFPGIVSGTNDYADTANSDIIVVTAGVPRKPGMTRDDLLGINAKILTSVLDEAIAHSPSALFLIVTNPLDIMCQLAYEKLGIDSSRVFGMGGVLDSARFAFAIAEKTGAKTESIEAWAIGAHGDAMTPMSKHSRVVDKNLPSLLSGEDIAEIEKRTIFGGAEVVAHLKTGSAFYAPAASIAKMVEAILTDSKEVLPVCSRLSGEYGINDLYLSVPARLGRGGVEGIIVFDLDEVDSARLAESAAITRASIEAAQI